MKTKLLLAFIALSLLSCSDDDSSTTPSVEKKLKQMVVSHYPDGPGASNYKEIHDFDDDNKLTQIVYYSPQNELSGKKTYEYNQMGLLSVVKTYDPNLGIGDPNEPVSVVSFNYDGSLRIIGMNSSVTYGIEGVQTVTLFTYNTDNTISAKEITSAPPEEDVIKNYTYYKNADGRIFKKVDSEGVVLSKAVFGGDNMVSWEGWFGTINYQFNIPIAPKGQYININMNRFDGNFNNTILADGFGAVNNGVSKYVSQVGTPEEPDNVTYEYEFDADRYPIKVSLFIDGIPEANEVREITYQ